LSYTEGKSYEYFLTATNPLKVLVATPKITVKVSQVCKSQLDLISTTIIKEIDVVLYPDDFTEDKSETTVLQTFLTDNKLG
jgi:hypothetical protein